MRRLKLILGAVVLGAAFVLPPASPAQAVHGCSIGANPLPFNTCTMPIPCDAPTVSVAVSMTGAGSVTGTATCGPAAATCTASGPPSGSCGATVPALTGMLTCGATVSGVVPVWQVTCTVP